MRWLPVAVIASTVLLWVIACSLAEKAQREEARPVAEKELRGSSPAPPPREAARSQAPELDRLRALGYANGGTAVSPYAGSFGAERQRPNWNTERYDAVREVGFLDPVEHPLSTFSIDVDTASYSNVRRFLEEGQLPPKGAVRIEELVNYFSYDYDAEPREHPFSVQTELSEAPWKPGHLLLQIGLQGLRIDERDLPPRNLVFLLDVSGSMSSPDKLGLVKRGLAELVERLRPEDRVAMVVYAGASGLVLPPTSGAERESILDALARLEAGGSTHGAQGIVLAYEVARRSFDPEAVNRVILATDGDFNVGLTSRSELVELIEEERESGVFLSVLGVGRGNLNDAGLEQLADHGNGNYAYLDSLEEARKVLVAEAGGTLVTIAKDVKIQLEMNPARVRGYRLIGYENRRLEDRDFHDDRVDAGEIGAGHSVTAFYEIVPVGAEVDTGEVGPLKYQREPRLTRAAGSDEWLTLELRYKQPDGERSQRLSQVVAGEPLELDEASEDLRFGGAVALFGMLLRESELAGDADWERVRELAELGLGDDRDGQRRDFLRLAERAQRLDGGRRDVARRAARSGS